MLSQRSSTSWSRSARLKLNSGANSAFMLRAYGFAGLVQELSACIRLMRTRSAIEEEMGSIAGLRVSRVVLVGRRSRSFIKRWALKACCVGLGGAVSKI